MTYDELKDLLAHRRCKRHFKPEAPSREVLTRIITAGGLAPSAGNRQPWRFIVCTNREVIAQAVALVKARREDLLDNTERRFREELADYSEYFLAFNTAPCLILPVYRAFPAISRMVKAGIAREPLLGREHDDAVMSVSLAIGHILLAVETEGLGCGILTGPLIAEEELNELFRVPKGWQIAAVIPVGVPDDSSPKRPRRDPEKLIRWIEPEP